MAASKIFSITGSASAAIAYIANPDKTENGKWIDTFMCSQDPKVAAKDFEEVSRTGTGRSSITAQHFIVSFQPGEVTPEKAMEVGAEIADKLLKSQYQHYLAVHTDREHLHVHCIFNSTNLIDGKTFQTHSNQGKVSERMWKMLRDITDEVCHEHNLSVIKHPERSKGKSHWEWDMNWQGLSWKAKLKNAIDKVVAESESWEDFLRRCAENGILVQYNPEHKIDLKFMLAEQLERNPRAKYTRSRTLGWYYETSQIKSRIDSYCGVVSYVPKSKIRKTEEKTPENRFIQDAITRGNMKVASIAKNILTQYGVSPENMRSAAMKAYAQRGKLSADLNRLQTEIEDSKAVLKVLKRYHKVRGIHAELKNLSGRKEKKFREQNSYELQEYKEVSHQLLEWFPDKHLPTVDELEQKITALMQERSDKNELYHLVSQKSKDLAQAQQTIEEFLRQERAVQEQSRKKKKSGDLE